ncbi:dihydrofolate reductase [Leptospira perolatii]|uniref:Dihydrofolate reductase n=1 Tax=Leptospira perolatii TaxID=2023191 RepID=A0A2M9ZNW9_9LEPT|nr:dihydrofolate reductase family protein [Leptospira perolatii]PJZ70882.1 dihydrofolate reductase [Leptospira perolatii]PJZ73778.1 dihydrofolate reductase [Leptospira perolatii]
MRKLVLFMHSSLDGFVAGTSGEMDWIKVDDEMFEFAGQRTNEADTALYGRVTYQMMESYWPSAGEQPNATKHDLEHSKWYNQVSKVVVSKTLQEASLKNTKVISKNIPDEIRKLKSLSGKDILVFGSPTTMHALMHENLIDDYWIFVNPILLGAGIPLFQNIKERTKLTLVKNQTFRSGVVCLHYTLEK